MKTRDDLKLLLLQIREGDKVRREEHKSFAQYCQISPSQIDVLNVFDTPRFSPEVVDSYDALLVGGASEASVLEPETYPFIQSGEAILLYCLNKNIPVFASCFGFQLAVIALGGNVIRDEQNYEMGTIPISLTATAASDPIFKNISAPFLAVSVHKEKTTELPEDCELLAYTDNCIHSFRVNNKPFWTFQFHPEVDKATLVERLTHFKQYYTENDAQLEQVLTTAQDTPISNDLVNRFVQSVLLTR